MGTSHELGQNFARAFDITYSDETGQRRLVWQTSWGVSTRLVGGLIMAHGDDAGLRLPPALAPTQVVVLLVRAEDGAGEAASALTEELAAQSTRVVLDDRVDLAFGRRSVDWELKGVPVRIEVGPRDLAEGRATLVRRDTATKEPVLLGDVARRVVTALHDAQRSLLEAARLHRESRTVDVSSLEAAVEAASVGFARLPWASVCEEGERRLAERGVTVRCLRGPDDTFPVSGDAPDLVAVVGRAY
jgi:prolyl-tRNA synthetase